MILHNYNKDAPEFVNTALEIIRINGEIKAELPTANGASIGMCIINACHATRDLGMVKDFAKSCLVTQIPAIASGPQPDMPDKQPSKTQEPNLNDIPDDEIPF